MNPQDKDIRNFDDVVLDKLFQKQKPLNTEELEEIFPDLFAKVTLEEIERRSKIL